VSLWDRLWQSLFGNGESARPAPPEDASTTERGGVALLTEPAKSPRPAAKPEECWWACAPGAPVRPTAPPTFEWASEARGLERILASCSERDNLRLPSLPKAAESALRILGGRKADARSIAGAIAEDQVLSMAVLRMANSARYGGLQRVQDLQTAVARLGQTTMRSLLLQHSLQAAMQPRRGVNRRLPGCVWTGALASAHIVRGLAELTHANLDEAYLVGLLHDIGSVVVLSEALDQEKLLSYQLDLRTFVWLCRAHHQRLGGLVATAWQLPDHLRDIITDHHRPSATGEAPSTEVLMLELADMIKAMLGYSPLAAYNIRGAEAAQLLRLANQPEFTAFLDRLPEDLSHLPPTF